MLYQMLGVLAIPFPFTTVKNRSITSGRIEIRPEPAHADGHGPVGECTKLASRQERIVWAGFHGEGL
jgi:hypothetical protein